MADTKDDNKVFDVAKPGKTAATPTARPVIIGHKSMLKDPMVKDEGMVDLIAGTNVSQKIAVEQDDKPSGGPVLEPTEAEPGTAPAVTRLKIGPITSGLDSKKPEEKKTEEVDEQPPKKAVKLQILPTDQATPTEAEPETTDDSAIKDSLPEEKPSDGPKADQKSESKPTDQPKTSGETVKNNSSTSDDAAAVGAVASQAGANKKSDKEAQEEATKKAAIEKLITDKKYFAPIGVKTRKKRSLQNILLGTVLIIVLGALLADVLLDAGLLHYNNIQAPIRVINR